MDRSPATPETRPALTAEIVCPFLLYTHYSGWGRGHCLCGQTQPSQARDSVAIQGYQKGYHSIDTLHWGFSTGDRDQRTLGESSSGPQLGNLGPTESSEVLAWGHQE